jgi:hypothetical protein
MTCKHAEAFRPVEEGWWRLAEIEWEVEAGWEGVRRGCGWGVEEGGEI